MSGNPKIKLKLTTADKILEALSWVSVFAIWVLVIVNYAHLPDVIPTHYNSRGEADIFSGKSNIFMFPIIATILFVGLTILNKYPHIFNYPTIITESNALYQYKNATSLIRILKLIIMVVFGFIVLQTVRNANTENNELGVWALPIILVSIFLPIIYFVLKSFSKS